MSLTQARLKELLHYDPVTGAFTWRVGRIGAGKGKRAGYRAANGYCSVRVDGCLYYAHRLAFLYTTGEWPPNEIDHRNGNPTDNRWLNLRTATRSQNEANNGPHAGNRSGFKGVIRNGGRWQTRCGAEYIGLFVTREEAARAYDEAALARWGEFARLNFPAA